MHGRDEGVRFYRRHEVVENRELLAQIINAICGRETLREHRSRPTGSASRPWMQVVARASKGPGAMRFTSAPMVPMMKNPIHHPGDPVLQAGFVLFCGTVHPAAWWQNHAMPALPGKLPAECTPSIFWSADQLAEGMSAVKHGDILDRKVAEAWFAPRLPADPAMLDNVVLVSFLPAERRENNFVNWPLQLILDPHDLGRHGFGEIMDPVQAAQVLQSAIATRARPELDVDFSDPVRIQAAGFDRRTSFRNMKRN